jgi:N-formylglutamate deformylase
MLLSERTVPPYRYRRGSSALIVSMPHVGTFVPHSIGRGLSDCAARRPDTDWHLPRLYDFLGDLGATMIVATHSRYVVDVNRPPDGSNLYPGRDTPRLCPIDTFHSEPLYRDGAGPDDEEVRRRVNAVWRPYHRRLESEIARVRLEHGAAILWDAHSIVSEAPRLFEGRLTDFNLGTADGASCDPGLANALLVALQRRPGYSAVLNGRFKGGYITRRYGKPDDGVHAVQMELACRGYMREPVGPVDESNWPVPFDATFAAGIRATLRAILETCLHFAENGKARPT